MHGQGKFTSWESAKIMLNMYCMRRVCYMEQDISKSRISTKYNAPYRILCFLAKTWGSQDAVVLFCFVYAKADFAKADESNEYVFG